MDVNEKKSLNLVRRVAEAYPGTWADHVAIQNALKVIEAKFVEEPKKNVVKRKKLDPKKV